MMDGADSPSTLGHLDLTADAIIAALTATLPGIAATFGPTCEVVLHDYRNAPGSVVAVSGAVTGRKVGSPLSEIGMRVLAQGESAENDVNYLTRTPTGKHIKSSTLPLRNGDGHVFGALCINVDVTALRQAVDLLGGLVESSPTTVTTFADDFDLVVDAVVRDAEATQGSPHGSLTAAERLHVVGVLDERGVFAVRSAAPRVAERLGISRASLYADLAKIRHRATGDGG